MKLFTYVFLSGLLSAVGVALLDYYIQITREPVRCDGGEPEKYDLWMWVWR